MFRHPSTNRAVVNVHIRTLHCVCPSWPSVRTSILVEPLSEPFVRLAVGILQVNAPIEFATKGLNIAHRSEFLIHAVEGLCQGIDEELGASMSWPWRARSSVLTIRRARYSGDLPSTYARGAKSRSISSCTLLMPRLSSTGIDDLRAVERLPEGRVNLTCGPRR
ncbi:uncharacterized protein C8Q71DRAFT_767793 [Rhodofomes roseus]|uniref:Uncharacterized protein n=1 Tax=Rhodofomes roseus TaxID=34475 RepID=A0ABQ8KBN3_9APHY|nr:uncharacterized protein C8Q71DRAFT_767793 [Rhodofomes roseus]KAH9834960.1 hypothetical protein C8Q71DRAFT_767793 [Rhodofomes roseus]